MQFRTTISMALAALAFSVAAVSNAHAECRSFKVTSAEMIGSTLDKAKRNARGSWERKVNRMDGIDTAWHDWANAKERHYSCRKKNGTHRCKATARPCTRSGGAAPEMDCKLKPSTGSTAKASSLERAKKEARGNWEKTTGGDWGKARNQKYDCRKKGKHRWYCNGIALMCWERDW
jgi:hypothetical protein